MPKKQHSFEPISSANAPHHKSLFTAIIGLIVVIATVGGLLIYSYSRAQHVGTAIETQLPAEQPSGAQESFVAVQRPSCEPEGTYLLCTCSAKRIVDIDCSVKSKTSQFYNAETSGGTISGIATNSAIPLSCTWQRVDTFEQLVPGNLCNDLAAQNEICEKAAKTKPSCQLSGAERYTIDRKLGECINEASLMCTSQILQSKKHDLFNSGALEGST